jgi:acetylornithine deacetylase
MIHDPLSTESIAALAQALIRCPSVNPSIAPDEAQGEDAVATLACEWLNEHGVEAWKEDDGSGRPNAVAKVEGEPGPTLVLCAHLDTVGTAGMEAAFEPTIRDGRLYGRGSYDMKGSAAAIMCAAVALTRRPLVGRLMLALVADEEYASVGAQRFVERHRADACILTEASAGDLVLAHRGFVWAEIVTRGRRVHGSRWDLGVSAVGRMGRVIAALDDFDTGVLRRRAHPLLGPASMHCAIVAGGVGLSTYAPECKLQVERRTLPGEATATVLEELRSCARVGGDGVEVRLLLERAPLDVSRDAPIANCVRDAATRTVGTPPREIGVPYWLDAAIFAAGGIPTVNFGPDGDGAHETIEWVDLESLVRVARVTTEAALGFHRFAAPRATRA